MKCIICHQFSVIYRPKAATCRICNDELKATDQVDQISPGLSNVLTKKLDAIKIILTYSAVTQKCYTW